LSPWGTLVLDARGVIRHADSQARSLIGATAGPGSPLVSLVRGDDDHAQVGAACAVAARGERASLMVGLVGGARVALTLSPAEPDGTIAARVIPLEQDGPALDEEALARAISHDVRAPLRAIEAFADFLAEDAGPLPERASEDLARLRGAAQRLRGQLDALVAWLRAGQAARGSCFVGEVAARVVERFARSFEAAGGSLALVGAARGRASVPADTLEEQLVRVVENVLVHNAGRPVRATVALTERDGATEVVVSDDGRGIGDADLARGPGLFQRTGPRARDDVRAGAGLAIVQRAVRAWGGALALARSADGGLAVRMTLPGESVRAAA
jgi:signal transduction histidine kinase